MRTTVQLPQELVEVEILSRLPVKPLLRFRCACKSWKSLIDSSDFVKLHRSKYSNSEIFLFQKGGPSEAARADRYLRSAEVDLQNCSDRFLFRYLKLPVSVPTLVQVVGSCHGLICISTCIDFVLVNPSTREYRRLPPFGNWSCVGLGYDCCRDEYKFVLIPRHGSEVNIYGSKSNTWRQVDVSSEYKSLIGISYGKYSHGALHWIVNDHPRMTFRIIAFDIANEKFTVVGVYEKQLFGSPVYVNLEILGGRICLCCAHGNPEESEGSYMDIWVMEEYGVKKSCSKLVSFDIIIKPLAFSNCGRRLLFEVSRPWPCNCRLHWYDLDKKTMGCTNNRKASFYYACLQSLIRLEEKLP